MLFRYVAYHYLKNMLIILLGLSGLFSGLDYLMNSGSLPSFNIKVLYAFSKWEEALNLLYPLAIIFGGIWTKISFIKKNTIGSFYALGLTRKELFRPFLFVGLFTYFIFLGLNFTSFAVANETAFLLKKNQYGMSKTEDLFFKYNDGFVYIGTLLPEEYKLENLIVFKMKNNKITRTLSAKEAWFNIHEWVATDVLEKRKVLNDEGKFYIKIETIPALYTLKNYEPKILHSIYDGQKLTLLDSLSAKSLFEKQHFQTEALRADIYTRVVTPLFSIALLMILMFRFPFHARYMNIVTTTMKALGGTLFIWGILFALQGIGASGTIVPELAIILPVVLLWGYGFYSLMKSDKRI